MKVERTSPASFTVVFETEEELRGEYASNLSAGGLRLETGARLPNFAPVSLTLRLGERTAPAKASVVGALPGALALALEAKPDDLLSALLPVSEETAGPGDAIAASLWDRLRGMSHVEKLLLAARAERVERAVLIQENDPQVLYHLLKNPRIGVEEVARIAKSAYLSFQTAELIVKTPQWANHPDVKVALVHNPKTPPAMALRILATLPTAEISKISRGAAVSQALKQAALKLLITSG